MKTQDECKKILFNIGIKLGVSPKLIVNRLLSDDDKQDMMNNNLNFEALECHVQAWKDARMPNCKEGKLDTYKPRLGVYSR